MQDGHRTVHQIQTELKAGPGMLDSDPWVHCPGPKTRLPERPELRQTSTREAMDGMGHSINLGVAFAHNSTTAAMPMDPCSEGLLRQLLQDRLLGMC